MQVPGTPDLDGPGVAIALDPKAGGRFRVGRPVLLHGACGATGAVLRRTGGRGLSAVMLIVVRRDKPAGRMRQVLDVGRPAPEPETQEPEEDDGVRLVKYNFFNLDLRDFFGLPDEPAKYWVMGALADWVSDRLAFEVVPPDEAAPQEAEGPVEKGEP
jgi:hypothetical protein